MKTKANYTLRVNKNKRQLLGVLLVVILVAWVFSIPTVGSRVASALKISDANQFSYYADVIFTFAVSLLFLILAGIFVVVPLFGLFFGLVAVSIAYHGLRKVKVIP